MADSLPEYLPDDCTTEPVPLLLWQLGPWVLWIEVVAGVQLVTLTWRGARWGAWAAPGRGRPS